MGCQPTRASRIISPDEGSQRRTDQPRIRVFSFDAFFLPTRASRASLAETASHQGFLRGHGR
jgi:hypothetical protein